MEAEARAAGRRPEGARMRTRLPAAVGTAALALACGAWVPGATLAQVGPADPPADTTTPPPPDSTAFILEPLLVGVARERAMPPPVISETVDPVVVQQSQEANPYRILRQATGVEVHDQGQGPGFASNVTIRGFTSDHSSDVLLVIDGVPVNLPAHGHIEGYADWNVLMARSVSSMRVIHGGASPLYGDFALGGVVEVFTRADAEGLEGALGATSFGDVRADLAGGRRGERGGTFLAGALQRNEGWRDNSDYWLTNAIARGWRSVGEEGRLEAGVSVYATEWNSPGFVSIPRFNLPELAGAVDPSDGGDSRRVVANGRYSTPVGAATYLQTALWAMASDYALFLNIPGHSHDGADQGVQVQSGEWDERIGAGAGAELARTLEGGGDVVVGVSGRTDGIEYRHAATFDRDVLTPEIDLDARHASGSLYGRWRRTFGTSLGVDLGARLDVLNHRSRSNLAAEGPASSEAGWDSATNAVFSPKAGLRYLAGRAWSVRASSARGFRSPAGIIGDPSREPFIAWSHELGVDWARGPLAASLSLFRIDVSNERIQDPITLAISSAGSSTRQGLSAVLDWEPSSRIGLDARATWNHARLSGAYADAHDDHPHEVFASGTESPVSSTTAEDGAAEATSAYEVPGVAEYQAFARLSLRPLDDLEWWISGRSVGAHVPIGEPTVETRPYTVADLGITWTLGAGRALDIEFQNLTDVRYVELRSSGFVVPGTPRSVRMQMRVGVGGAGHH